MHHQFELVMKRRIITLFLVAIPLLAPSKVDVKIMEDNLSDIEIELLKTGLTLVSFTTINGEIPSCEFVSAPDGSMGRGIINATKVKGRLIIRRNKETLSSLFEKGVVR